MLKAVARQRLAAGPHTITAADPLPGDLHQSLEAVNRASRTMH